MLVLHRHEPTDYAGFPDIDEPGVGLLSDDDRECLDRLGGHLVSAKAHDRFGISLLHRHFLPEADEIFVEEVDDHARQNTLRPVRRSTDGLAPVNVSFKNDVAAGATADIGLVGLEYVSRETLGEFSPISSTDLGVISGVKRILERHGKLRRFGLRLLHDPIRGEGDVLVERCYPAERRLVCSVVKTNDPVLARTIQTVFRWESQDGETASDKNCVRQCEPVQVCLTINDYHSPRNTHDRHHVKNA